MKIEGPIGILFSSATATCRFREQEVWCGRFLPQINPLGLIVDARRQFPPEDRAPKPI